MKLASSMLPTCCGVALPGIFTVTTPSLPTVTLCASAGMVMSPARARPLEVTRRPCASTCRLPSRV